jgi:hypothetical protein
MLREGKLHAKNGAVRPAVSLAALCLVALAGCAGESDQLVRRKLEVILADDLASVVMELPANSVRDSAFYRVREYRRFAEGPYAALAVVDFHFLKGDVARMVRKYRYHKWDGQWERYVNEYRLAQDTARSDATP